MARFLAYTSPARGHLYPIMGALLELRSRGHEVHVRTLASEVDAVRAAGLYAEPLDPAIEALPLDDYRFKTPEEALAGGMRTFLARSPHEVADVQRAVADVEPDALAIDVTTPGAASVAQSTGLPWGQWIPFFQHVTIDGELLPTGLVPFALNADGMEAINSPRRELGLPELSEDETFFAPLYAYFTAPPFEIAQLALPASVRMVGPGLWEPPAETPAWLEGVDEPVVMVTASSEYQLDHALIEAALRAFESDDLRVAASTVAHDPGGFDVPRNARVERWLPHGPVVERAACVVCHGGMGITQRALAAGVPVCVVPFGRDQMEVAGRVKASGCGTAVMPDALSPSSLRDAVHEAMAMRDGARRVADGFARAGGARAAADAFEAQLATGAGRRLELDSVGSDPAPRS